MRMAGRGVTVRSVQLGVHLSCLFRESDYIMAEATSRSLPPKTVTFTGPPGPSKGI